MKFIIFLTSLFVLSCTNQEGEFVEKETQLEEVKTFEDNSFEIRINGDLKFSISDQTRNGLSQRGDFDLGDFTEALNTVADDENYISEDDWANDGNADVNLKIEEEARHVVVWDKRAYDIPQSEETDAATDYANLKAMSESLLMALGSTEYEFGTPNLAYLKAWDREVDPGNDDYEVDFDSVPINERRICMKAFYHRKIDGIDVDVDRMIFSYALDGTFRKMIGFWRPIDWENSSLEVDTTRGQFIDKLQTFIESEQHLLDAARDHGVDARTCIELEETNSGTWIAELKGCVKVAKRVNGPFEAGVNETHYFDLR